MIQRSYGNGRRMTVAEAIERRARMIRFHGSLVNAWHHGRRYRQRIPSFVREVLDSRHLQDRRWSEPACFHCNRPAEATNDVSNAGELIAPLSCCQACRGTV